MGGAHTIVTQHSQVKPGKLLGQSYYGSWFYKSPRGFLTRQARLTYATHIGLEFQSLAFKIGNVAAAQMRFVGTSKFINVKKNTGGSKSGVL